LEKKEIKVNISLYIINKKKIVRLYIIYKKNCKIYMVVTYL